MTLAPASRLGDYEVLSALGAGGMGEVYRARDARLNRDVTVKVLPADRLADEHRRRRFQQEVSQASRRPTARRSCTSPGWIGAYGFSVGTKGVYYYPCRPEGPPVALGRQKPIDIRLIDPATGHDRAVASVSDLEYGDVFWGPRVSPDGTTILYTKVVNRGEDLMMLENFR